MRSATTQISRIALLIWAGWGCAASGVRGLEPADDTAAQASRPVRDVTASDYAPRLDVLALGYSDGRFEVRSPAPRHVLSSGKHESRIMNLALSKDGQRLASCDGQGILAVSQVQTGELELLPRAPGEDDGTTRPVGLAWDARGVRLAVARNRAVRVTDVESGASHESRLGSDAHAVAFSPDGRNLVVAGSHLTFLSLPDLKVKRHFTLPQEPGLEALPDAADVRYGPNGLSLGVLTTTGVALFDVASGTFEAAFPKRLAAVGLRYAEDGRILLFGRRALYVGEPKIAAIESAIRATTGTLWDAEFRQDGSLMLLGDEVDAELASLLE